MTAPITPPADSVVVPPVEDVTEVTPVEGELDEGTAPVTRAEYEAVLKRMKAADRRSSELELKERQRQAATQSETERLTTELGELKSFRETADSELRKLRIDNAFLSANTHSWVDSEDALRLADLSGVEIDEEGNVDKKALSAALNDLAKRKPHLVKAATSTSGQKPPVESSGPEMNGQPKGGESQIPDRAALAKRFPVLGKW